MENLLRKKGKKEEGVSQLYHTRQQLKRRQPWNEIPSHRMFAYSHIRMFSDTSVCACACAFPAWFSLVVGSGLQWYFNLFSGSSSIKRRQDWARTPSRNLTSLQPAWQTFFWFVTQSFLPNERLLSLQGADSFFGSCFTDRVKSVCDQSTGIRPHRNQYVFALRTCSKIGMNCMLKPINHRQSPFFSLKEMVM